MFVGFVFGGDCSDWRYKHGASNDARWQIHMRCRQ